MQDDEGKKEGRAEPRKDQAPRLPVKTAVTLSFEAHRKLRSAALHKGCTQSELVEDLVVKHLAGYHVAGPRESGQGERVA